MPRLLTAGLFALWATAAATSPGQAQMRPDTADLPLDAATRDAVIDRLAEAIRDHYIVTEVGARAVSALRDSVRIGALAAETSSRGFARGATAVLQSVAGDAHLRLSFRYEPVAERALDAPPIPEEIARRNEMLRRRNYGFRKVEVLPGNIGYLEFTSFARPHLAGSTAAAAMGFLANVDALIVDLRGNRGGYPEMVALVASFLFPADEPVHLNSIESREGNRTVTRQSWTLPWLPGRRLDSVPVYVLTSHRTFSGAEELSYDVQQTKRATIVGERTGGGANPGRRFYLGPHFEAFVSMGRAVNPITNDNWEGRGVVPDVAVPADSALIVARRLTLERLLETATDPDQIDALRRALEEVTAPELHGSGAGSGLWHVAAESAAPNTAARVESRADYARFVVLWDGCNLHLQPLVNGPRTRLARLAGEATS